MVREPADAVLVVTDRAASVFWHFEVLKAAERGVSYQRIV